MKTLLRHLLPYKKEAILAPSFKLLEACFDLLVPLVVAWMIDCGLAQGDASIIWRALAILVGLSVAGLAMAGAAQYFAAKAATRFAAAIRRALFAKIGRLSFAQLDRYGADSLATRMTSDAAQTQTAVNLLLRLFLRSPIIVLGATIMALVVSPRGAFIFIVALPALATAVFSILFLSLPLYTRQREALDDVSLSTTENLVGARVLRAFNMEPRETKRFNALASRLLAIQERAGLVAGLMNPITYLMANLAIVALLASGAAQVNIGTSTQGETIALLNYMSQILVELVKLANLLVQVNKGAACAKRVAEILNLPDGMTEGDAELCATREAGAVAVEFEGASASYGASAGLALESVSFRARIGETIGVIGGTGSGKTTLVNLIARFYDASRGVVRVFGRDVREYRLASLRAGVGVVPQKAELFSGTIESNLRWGDPQASESELYAALETAQARDFVEAKPEKLSTVLEQGGRNLSGGQRQRLTIARALVKDAPILILDDSCSALDYATDARLREALAKTKSRRATFIVAQRAASVLDADQILVLDEGRLVGKGRHEELLRDCPTYREIYESQFSEDATSKVEEARR